MTPATLPPVLEALLASWDRHNEVLLNLLGLVPPGGLEARAGEGSPSVAQMLTHVHHERMVSVEEEAPEALGAVPLPEREWDPEPDPERIAAMLRESAQVVREAVRRRTGEGRPTELHFDHPCQLLAFLIFHEGYHHGQIKLALKASGMPIPDEVAGPATWRVWRRRG